MTSPAASSPPLCSRCLHSAQVPVIAGFAVMILLLIAGAAIGISYLRILGNQLTTIVLEHDRKAELASDMKRLHEARFQTLLLASAQDDAFERDEQAVRFSELASRFIASRDRFLALPLTPQEQAVWEAVRKEMPGVQDSAERAFDLMREGQRESARLLIVGPLRQHQERMMKQWDVLVDMQRVSNNRMLAEADDARVRARNLVLGLSILALLVAVGVALFVTRLSRRLEADLFEERERALVTLRSIGDAVVRFDQDRKVNYLNPVAESMLGLAVSESGRASEGQSANQSLHLYERETRSDLTDALMYDVLRGTTYVLPPSACLLSSQGLEYEVEGKCSPIHSPEGPIIGGVLVMSDVTEARELQRKLLWHSDHDALTGVGNRHAFEDRLEQSLGSKRAAQLPMSLLLIGLDQLKKVSEGAGHAGSDELLRELAAMMDGRVRDSDLLARLGYDEFAVLLHSCPNDMAERIATQIRDGVMNHVLVRDGQTYRVGVHIGVVHLGNQTQEECIEAARSAIHEAKAQGQGSIHVYREAEV